MAKYGKKHENRCHGSEVFNREWPFRSDFYDSKWGDHEPSKRGDLLIDNWYQSGHNFHEPWNLEIPWIGKPNLPKTPGKPSMGTFGHQTRMRL